MGNLYSCDIDSCNNKIEMALNNYEDKLKYMLKYESNMNKKGIDIYQLKKNIDELQIDYKKVKNVVNDINMKKIDELYNEAMKRRRNNQLVNISGSDFGKTRSKGRSRRSNRRGSKRRSRRRVKN